VSFGGNLIGLPYYLSIRIKVSNDCLRKFHPIARLIQKSAKLHFVELKKWSGRENTLGLDRKEGDRKRFCACLSPHSRLRTLHDIQWWLSAGQESAFPLEVSCQSSALVEDGEDKRASLGVVSYESSPSRVVDFVLSVILIPILRAQNRRQYGKRQKKREQLTETFTARVVIEIESRRHTFCS
jgi:hypothetical protein